MKPTIVWVNIFGNSLTAVSFLVIAVTLIVFLFRRDIGHRLLIRLTIMFSVVRCIISLATIWDLTHRFTLATALIRSFGALVGLVLVLYFVIVNTDIINTLSISEYFDRLRKDADSDKEQARQQMVYLSGETRRRSEAILQKSSLH